MKMIAYGARVVALGGKEPSNGSYEGLAPGTIGRGEGRRGGFDVLERAMTRL